MSCIFQVSCSLRLRSSNQAGRSSMFKHAQNGAWPRHRFRRSPRPPAAARPFRQVFSHGPPSVPVGFSLVARALGCVGSCGFSHQLGAQLGAVIDVCGLCGAHTVRAPCGQVVFRDLPMVSVVPLSLQFMAFDCTHTGV